MKTDDEEELYTLEVSPDIRHDFECGCHPVGWEKLRQVFRHHADFSQSCKDLRNSSEFARFRAAPEFSRFRSLIFPIALNGFDEWSLFVIFAGRSIMGEELRPVVSEVMGVQWEREFFNSKQPRNTFFCAFETLFQVMVYERSDFAKISYKLASSINNQTYLTLCSRRPWPNSLKCLVTIPFACSARIRWTVLQRIWAGACHSLIILSMNVFWTTKG